MKIAIIKYNAGNVVSVSNALKRLGAEPFVSDDPGAIIAADRVIFPGVGEASSAMEHLRSKRLDEVIKRLEQPVLAICLGMQLLCKFSEENSTECFGILPQSSRRFTTGAVKVPHMGWNDIFGLRSRLFDGVAEGSRMYFVHSYFVENGEHTIAKTSYGPEFSSAVNKDNFFGVQFHPEKSAKAGARILQNFLNI